MDYKQAIQYLERLRGAGINLRLENITYLLDKLGNPQESLKCLHVAGTNGKGSVCAMISSILQNEGFRTGLYTSPHLECFRERIRVNNKLISERELASHVAELKPFIEEMRNKPLGEPSFFEAVTALAFLYFSRMKVDYAVIETGLGGRLDATNVINPLVSVVTNVSMDHSEYLGGSIEELAFEKAAIIKENGILVTAADDRRALDVLLMECQKKNAKHVLVADTSILRIYSNTQGSEFDYRGVYGIHRSLFIPLLGDHQLINAATAISAVEVLKDYEIRISQDAIKEGLSNVKWPGRLEIVGERPFIVLDGAHNPSGFKQLKKSLTELFTYWRLYLVVAVSSGKDYQQMIAEIASSVDLAVVTGLRDMDHVDPGLLAGEFIGCGRGVVKAGDMFKALDYALSKAGEEDLVCVTGSLYGVAEAMRYLKK
ncbi:MAG: bifunctional folylpolyglutamate synthase/dihydrofolate synthase [Candidatus Altiarchaeales archaeon ex4484_2]|nr:MAG: bifunctional folylpolyglutamate synthase/dihydrofolate synthase [Candidatus Altiarchaeales archaeon ex4484_2]